MNSKSFPAYRQFLSIHTALDNVVVASGVTLMFALAFWGIALLVCWLLLPTAGFWASVLASICAFCVRWLATAFIVVMVLAIPNGIAHWIDIQVRYRRSKH